MTYTKTNLTIIALLTVAIILMVVISSLFYYRWHVYDPVKLTGEDLDAKQKEFGERYLNWAVKETIEYTYEECKTINRTKPINRLLKPDYRLPMCPKDKVLLYDEYQKIVFKFNEDSKEPASIFTISTTSSAN